MDEPENDVARRGVAVLLGTGLLAFAAYQGFGTAGLRALLVLTVGAVAMVAFHWLTGRSFAGLAGRRSRDEAPYEPVKDDAWRSERWVREAVERGLRSLDEWRIDQQPT